MGVICARVVTTKCTAWVSCQVTTLIGHAAVPHTKCMKIIEDINELSKVIDAGATVWYKSAQLEKMLYWNTTGKEFAVDFPTIYAPAKLLAALRKQYHF